MKNPYKKKTTNEFEKAGFKVSLLDIDYNDVSICYVEVKDTRQTYCKIKNSPIYYFIIDGEGTFILDKELTVNKGDLLEIPSNHKYTYKGNMRMLEVIPNSFNNLDVEEELIKS